MEFKDIKVGQTVKHDNGFTGVVEEIKDSSFGGDILVRVTKQGDSRQEVGQSYVALPKYITLVSDISTNKELEINVNVNTNFSEVIKQAEELIECMNDLESVMMDVRLEAEEMAEIDKEESVFEVSFGEGINFKGTKSDFETFIRGFQVMTAIAQGDTFKF